MFTAVAYMHIIVIIMNKIKQKLKNIKKCGKFISRYSKKYVVLRLTPGVEFFQAR